MRPEGFDSLNEQERPKGFQEGFQQGFQEGFQQGFQEGFRQGFQEGFQQGFQEGQALMLLQLLGSKFEPLDSDIEQRVRSADANRLLEWAKRVLSAETLADIFED